MIQSPVRRLAAVLAAGLLSVLPAAASASAAPALPAAPLPQAAPGLAGQAPHDAGPAGRSTFGVQPSTAKKPDTRPNFSYGVTPGAAVSDHLAVWNYSARPLTLRVYAADAINTTEGGFDLLAAGRTSTDAGAWVRLGTHQVTVPGRARVIVPFTLTVPTNASAGDHTGGIVASLSGVRTDAKGDKVKVDQRVGARVYLRVAGRLAPRLAVEDLHTSAHGTANPFGSASATVTYTLHNTGNVRLSAHQTVKIRDLFGGSAKVAQPRDIPELLPGTKLVITAAATGVRPTVRDTTTVTADPGTVRGDVKQTVLPRATASAGFWAVPWTLLAALLVLLVAAVLLLVRFLRRRRGGAGRDVARSGTPGWRRPGRARAAAPTAMALAAAVLWSGAPHAAATPEGQLTVTPGRGSSTQPITLTAGAPCPGSATYVIARVAGAGFPHGGQIVVGNSPVATYPKTPGGGLSIPLTYTMHDYAMTAGFTKLHGTYTFTVTCLKGAFDRKGEQDFTGSLRFASAETYRDGTKAAGADPSTATGTDPGSDPNGTPAAPGPSNPAGTPATPVPSGPAPSGQPAVPGAAGPASPGATGPAAQGTDGTVTAAASTRRHSNSPLVAGSVAGFAVAFLALAAGAAFWLRGRRRAPGARAGSGD